MRSLPVSMMAENFSGGVPMAKFIKNSPFPACTGETLKLRQVFPGIDMCEGHPKPGFEVFVDMIVEDTSGGGKGRGIEEQLQTKYESGSFKNSYNPENPRTPKPLTFSKNRLRGAKNR
ncbi:hypothetical protein LXL04_014645 [Taraxacum kok-saghyz]